MTYSKKKSFTSQKGHFSNSKTQKRFLCKNYSKYRKIPVLKISLKSLVNAKTMTHYFFKIFVKITSILLLSREDDGAARKGKRSVLVVVGSRR
jgi:hypothetical protein